MKIFKLCNRPGGCCPTVEFVDRNTWIVTDDSGGKVTLTKEQIRILAERVLE